MLRPWLRFLQTQPKRRSSAKILICAVIVTVVFLIIRTNEVYIVHIGRPPSPGTAPQCVCPPPCPPPCSPPCPPRKEALSIPFSVDQDYDSNDEPIISPTKLKDLRYLPNGFVQVDPNSSHPIYQLIARAEKAWEEKLNRQSKTFDAAVIEYRRRYRREPPRGFDKWWEYVQKHQVQLPDEYDRIYHDLEPFWGLEPKTLAEFQAKMEATPDSYTLGQNESGNFEVLAAVFKPGRNKAELMSRYGDVLGIFRSLEPDIPPVRVTFNPHDNPERLIDFNVREALLKAASSKKPISEKDLPRSTTPDFGVVCGASRNITIDWNNPPPRSPQKAFIHDHHASMDPCLHPEYFYRHGFLMAMTLKLKPERDFTPLFSSCSTEVHQDIHFPFPYGWGEIGSSEIIPWDQKSEERVGWRGTNTGIATHPYWRHSHRHSMVAMANSRNGSTNVLRLTRNNAEKVGNVVKMRNADVYPAFFDIAFGGDPVQCDANPCSEVRNEFVWTAHQSVSTTAKFKYAVDIDGNAWSGRLNRLLTSETLVFKATIYHEWFMDRIQPWVHFVPVQIDLSDLLDAHIFFRGDEYGRGSHDNLARKIAAAGGAWSRTHWRREDMNAYIFRLLLEYARVSSLDRESMDYKPAPAKLGAQPKDR